MFKCLVCNKKFSNNQDLTTHIVRVHHLKIKEYYDKYLKQEDDGVCKVCSNPTEFFRLSYGYRKYCSVECAHKDKDLIKLQKVNREKSNLDKYGYKNLFQVPEKAKKIYKKQKSRVEQYIEEYFNSKNIKYLTQYKSTVYPYFCDFYIPFLDLYIEINFHWVHNGHFFDSNNQEDLKTLEQWKEKSNKSKFYERAIEIWTKRDLEKLNCAKNNNLNYLVIWNEKELETKLNDISSTWREEC